VDDICSDGRVLHISPAMRIAEKAISVTAIVSQTDTSHLLSSQ
jgi:hypothetical protein